MTYRGRVQNGVVVLSDPTALPEGTEVSVSPVRRAKAATTRKRGKTLSERLLKHAGKAKGLPSDLAVNHDHYLRGTPKKP